MKNYSRHPWKCTTLQGSSLRLRVLLVVAHDTSVSIIHRLINGSRSVRVKGRPGKSQNSLSASGNEMWRCREHGVERPFQFGWQANFPRQQKLFIISYERAGARWRWTSVWVPPPVTTFIPPNGNGWHLQTVSADGCNKRFLEQSNDNRFTDNWNPWAHKKIHKNENCSL